jgi:hypothetical protein
MLTRFKTDEKKSRPPIDRVAMAVSLEEHPAELRARRKCSLAGLFLLSLEFLFAELFVILR